MIFFFSFRSAAIEKKYFPKRTCIVLYVARILQR